MNLRKFISGVSALAIAASAFAGMAVTASAAYSQTARQYTWSFEDYTEGDANYDGVFTMINNASIGLSGDNENYGIIIPAHASNVSFDNAGKAAFVAPGSGKLTITYKFNGTSQKYVYGLICNSSGTVLAGGDRATVASTTTNSVSTMVTAGETYYLYTRGNGTTGSSTNSGVITEVSLIMPGDLNSNLAVKGSASTTFDIDTTSANDTAVLKGDYATASNAFVDMKVSLNAGDTIDSEGVKWAGPSVQNSSGGNTADKLSSTERYITVTPQFSGKLYVTATMTADTKRYYYADITEAIANGTFDTVNYGKNNSYKDATSGTSTYITDVTAGHTYLVCAFLYKNIDGGVTVTNVTLSDMRFSADFSITGDAETTPTVALYSDSARTVSVTNGQLVDGTTYYYTATADGYEEKQDSFTFDATESNIAINMSTLPDSAIAPDYTVPAASTNVVSNNDYTVSTQASSFNWRFLNQLETSEGAVSVSNFDMFLTDGSSIDIMTKRYRTLSGNYNQMLQGTNFTIQPGQIQSTWGKTDNSNNYAVDVLSGLTANNWYRVQITYANYANTISISVTNPKTDEVILNKTVTQRNNYDSGHGWSFVLNEHAITVTGTAYLANVKAYNPTVTYSYYADGVQVGEGVTVIQGLTPAAPTVPAKTGYTGEWVVDANDATVYNAKYTATRNAFDFGEQELSSLPGKTLKVTVDSVTKTGEIPSFTIGQGMAKFAVIITGIPEDAQSISAVIE